MIGNKAKPSTYIELITTNAGETTLWFCSGGGHLMEAEGNYPTLREALDRCEQAFPGLKIYAKRAVE